MKLLWNSNQVVILNYIDSSNFGVVSWFVTLTVGGCYRRPLEKELKLNAFQNLNA